MRPELAGRLSRLLVRWHPRRWRDRYGEEMLDVLDQHRPTARTVVNLWASAVSAQLDPAYRTDRLSPARLRRAALISAAIAAPLALVLAPVGYRVWYDGYWHPATDEGLAAVAFSPHSAILLIPGTCEAFFRTTGRPAESLTLPPPQQPDLDQLLAAMREHGIEFLAPPPAQ